MSTTTSTTIGKCRHCPHLRPVFRFPPTGAGLVSYRCGHPIYTADGGAPALLATMPPNEGYDVSVERCPLIHGESVAEVLAELRKTPDAWASQRIPSQRNDSDGDSDDDDGSEKI